MAVRAVSASTWAFHSRLADAVIDIYETSIRENNAIPRIGQEGELKGVTVFLASDDADYITGTALLVDGGFRFRGASE